MNCRHSRPKCAWLQPQVAQPRMVIWTPPLWPVIEPLRGLNRQIVDGCIPVMHEALGIELPVFVAISAIPLPGVVAPFIGEAHGNARAVKRPELLDEPVFKFTIRF